MPALLARNNALAQMDTLSKQFGTGPTAEEVMAEPGYEFGMTQGRNALEGSRAAAGGLYSGATGKALQKYGTDYASTKYGEAWTRKRAGEGDAFDRQRSIATGGQAGASTIAAAGQNGANQLSGIYSGYGDNAGAASIANANTYGGLASELGSIGSEWYKKQPPSGYQVGVGGNGAGGSPDGYWADGGPVGPGPAASAPDPALVEKYGIRARELLAQAREPRGIMHRINPASRVAAGERKALGYADGGPVGWSGPNMVGDVAMQPQFQRQGIMPTPRLDTARQTFGTNHPRLQSAFQRRRMPVAAYADGGPVEPKVGTKSPVREGGGGGMSNNAIIKMLIRQNLDNRRSNVNPLNPREVNADREERVNMAYGGEVDGPGGPREDAIPAQLSARGAAGERAPWSDAHGR
jgi:hypothetical protein